MFWKKFALFVIALVVIFFVSHLIVLATAVDRNGFCNLEGSPGQTIKLNITLEGTTPEERTGFWDVFYKKVAGDNERMDISSWITIQPKEYTIKQGETKVFNLEIKIPKNVEPGLWGAISEEACKEGHSNDRRTYLIFKDVITGGHVYSGLLLPISVKVIKSPNLLVRAMNFVKQNLLTLVLAIVVIILLVIILARRPARQVK